MVENLSVRLKALQEKLKNYEQKGENIKDILISLGFDPSSIEPPNRLKLSADSPSIEIFQLRLDHHESKREKIMNKVIKFIKEQKRKLLNKSPLAGSQFQSFTEHSLKKDSIDMQIKRRTEAADRVLKQHLENKVKLLQKLKEKELKSQKHKKKTFAQIKEKIEKFQEKEQKKYFSAKQHSIDFNDRKRVFEHKELTSYTPSIEKHFRIPGRSLNVLDNLEVVHEKLEKFEQKMLKASERHNKIIYDRIKQNERRSQSVLKVRNDNEKKKKSEDLQQMQFLIKLDRGMRKTRKMREENLNSRVLNKNKSVTVKAATMEKSGLEDFIRRKDKKTQEKLESLKNQFELNNSLKKEKYKLALSDVNEKRYFQSKARFYAKNKILEKHIQAAKLLESRKVNLEKTEQESREKKFQLSQSYAHQKTEVYQKLRDIEIKNSFLITNQL